MTVLGYASTTGAEKLNFDYYARQRAEWVRGILADTLGVAPATIHVASRGSYTAPASEQTHPGVPDPHERRAEIVFEETATMLVSHSLRRQAAMLVYSCAEDRQCNQQS